MFYLYRLAKNIQLQLRCVKKTRSALCATFLHRAALVCWPTCQIARELAITAHVTRRTCQSHTSVDPAASTEY